MDSNLVGGWNDGDTRLACRAHPHPPAPRVPPAPRRGEGGTRSRRPWVGEGAFRWKPPVVEPSGPGHEPTTECFFGIVALAQPIAAIHVQGLPDNVVRVIGSEENGGPHKVLRTTHAAIGHRFADKAFLLAKGPPFMAGVKRIEPVPHGRVHDPGRDRVDVDAEFDKGQGGRLGEADDRGLGSAIDGVSADPRRPAWLARLMILPPVPAAAMVRATACRVKNKPSTFTEKTRR